MLNACSSVGADSDEVPSPLCRRLIAAVCAAIAVLPASGASATPDVPPTTTAPASRPIARPAPQPEPPVRPIRRSPVTTVYQGEEAVSSYEAAWSNLVRQREAARLAHAEVERATTASSQAFDAMVAAKENLDTLTVASDAAAEELESTRQEVRSRAAAGYVLAPVSPALEMYASANPAQAPMRAVMLGALGDRDGALVTAATDARDAAAAAVQEAELDVLAKAGEYKQAQDRLRRKTREYTQLVADRDAAQTAFDDAVEKLTTMPPVTVAADGCPTDAPDGTLLGGATRIGIHQLCLDSIALARNSYAANAIQFALAQLGTPYSQVGRMRPGVFDCSSLAMRSYEAAGLPVVSEVGRGWAPTTWVIRGGTWVRHIPLSQALPGDLVFPKPGHVAMVLAHGYMVHASSSKVPTRVQPLYRNVFTAVEVLPNAFAPGHAPFPSPWGGNWVPRNGSDWEQTPPPDASDEGSDIPVLGPPVTARIPGVGTISTTVAPPTTPTTTLPAPPDVPSSSTTTTVVPTNTTGPPVATSPTTTYSP